MLWEANKQFNPMEKISYKFILLARKNEIKKKIVTGEEEKSYFLKIRRK